MTKYIHKLDSIIDELLENNLAIQEALALDICNVNGLAKLLKPQIENMTQQEMSVESVGMAIRRYLKKRPALLTKKVKFPKHIEINFRNNIFEIALENNSPSRKIIDKIKSRIEVAKGDLFTSIEGLYEIVLLTSDRYSSEINKIIGKHHKTSEVLGLGMITVNWPASTKSIPGIYYRITRSLALQSVSIQSFHTIGSEMMILVSEGQFESACKCVSETLNNLG